MVTILHFIQEKKAKLTKLLK